MISVHVVMNPVVYRKATTSTQIFQSSSVKVLLKNCIESQFDIMCIVIFVFLCRVLLIVLIKEGALLIVI